MSTWNYTVTLDGAAVDIVGLITVRTEESTAGSASFTYSPPKGQAFNPAELRGKAVTVSHSTGLLFTGTVESAEPTGDGLIRITATDGLLAHFDAMTEAEILQAIPGGHFHEAFFGPRTSGWAQAQSVLETVASEAHMTPAGALQISSWFGATSHTLSNAVYLSEGAQWANERNRVNAVDITVQYRFSRLKERRAVMSWVLPWFSSLPTWRANPTTLPSRDMIQAAADGTGWGILGGIQYITLPNDIQGWSPPPEQQERDAIYASVSLFHRWVQPVEETYQLHIEAPTGGPAPAITREAAHETPFPQAAWEGQKIAFDPGFLQDRLGDYYQDRADRADLETLLRCAIAWGQTRVTASARSNLVQFGVLLDASITLNSFVRITTPWLTAEGKVYALEHRMDTGRGGADMTVVALAVHPGPAAGTVGGEPPPPPSSEPTWQIGTLPGMGHTHIGSIDTAPPDDPDWVGYVGNYDPPRGGTGEQIYQGRFRIGAYEIEQQSLDAHQVTADTANYSTAVPAGELSFTPNPTVTPP